MLGAIFGAVCSIAAGLATYLSKGLSVLTKVCIVIDTLCKALGVGKPDQDLEELGDKALQAEEAGIKPEDYERYEDYRAAIENFEVDEEKSQNTPKEAKLLKGIELQLAGLLEKYPNADWGLLVECAGTNTEYFSPERIKVLAEYVKNDETVINNISKYLAGGERNEERFYETQDILKSIERKVNPNLTEEEISKYVRSLEG